MDHQEGQEIGARGQHVVQTDSHFGDRLAYKGGQITMQWKVERSLHHLLLQK